MYGEERSQTESKRPLVSNKVEEEPAKKYEKDKLAGQEDLQKVTSPQLYISTAIPEGKLSEDRQYPLVCTKLISLVTLVRVAFKE